jgi:hypothetical protein
MATKNWHFVNIPIEGDYDEKLDCVPNATYGDCIVAELNRLKNELHCTTGRMRARCCNRPLVKIESAAPEAIAINDCASALVCAPQEPWPLAVGELYPPLRRGFSMKKPGCRGLAGAGFLSPMAKGVSKTTGSLFNTL